MAKDGGFETPEPSMLEDGPNAVADIVADTDVPRLPGIEVASDETVIPEEAYRQPQPDTDAPFIPDDSVIVTDGQQADMRDGAENGDVSNSRAAVPHEGDEVEAGNARGDTADTELAYRRESSQAEPEQSVASSELIEPVIPQDPEGTLDSMVISVCKPADIDSIEQPGVQPPGGMAEAAQTVVADSGHSGVPEKIAASISEPGEEIHGSVLDPETAVVIGKLPELAAGNAGISDYTSPLEDRAAEPCNPARSSGMAETGEKVEPAIPNGTSSGIDHTVGQLPDNSSRLAVNTEGTYSDDSGAGVGNRNGLIGLDQSGHSAYERQHRLLTCVNIADYPVGKAKVISDLAGQYGIFIREIRPEREDDGSVPAAVKGGVTLTLTAYNDRVGEFWSAVEAEIKNRLSERLGTAENERQAYLAMLDMKEYPESAGDMPDEIYLPPELTGQLGRLIDLTRGDKRERLQRIRWSGETNSFEFGKLVKGNDKQVDFILPLFRPSLRVRDRHIMEFHTHPSDAYAGAFFSFNDFDRYTWSKSASVPYINAVGSGSCAYFLFSTGQFEPRHSLKWWSTADLNSNLPRNRIAKLKELGIDDNMPRKSAEILESMGLVVYRWMPARNAGYDELSSGAKLRRVSADYSIWP